MKIDNDPYVRNTLLVCLAVGLFFIWLEDWVGMHRRITELENRVGIARSAK